MGIIRKIDEWRITFNLDHYRDAHHRGRIDGGRYVRGVTLSPPIVKLVNRYVRSSGPVG